MRADTIAGLLMLDELLERTASQLSLDAMAVDGATASCDHDGDVYAAQRLQDAAQRLRMVAATVASVQAVLRTLAGDGEDADATAELGPLLGGPKGWRRRPGEPCLDGA